MLGNVHNINKTSSFFATTLQSSLAQHARARKKHLKFRLTLAVIVNAIGIDRMKPLFIGKAKQPRSFQKEFL